MGLSQVRRILARRRWVILATFLSVIIGTELLTLAQPPEYESSATFVLKLTGREGAIEALEILSRRPEIPTTFAQAADSRLLKNRAATELGLSDPERGSVDVSSRLIAGTNILEISAIASDPDLAAGFCNELGRQVIRFVENLYAGVSLEPLDAAEAPEAPARPNPLLNLSLAALLGATLGLALALAPSFVSSARPVSADGQLTDPESGAYSDRFFVERVRHEASRAVRNGSPLSVALVNVDCSGVLKELAEDDQVATLRRIAALGSAALREEDLLARVGQTVFGVLLVDASGIDAVRRVERLKSALAGPSPLGWTPASPGLISAAGIATYDQRLVTDGAVSGDGDLGFIVRAREALELAQLDPKGGVRVLSLDGAVD